MDNSQIRDLMASTGCFLVTALLLSSLPVSGEFYDAIVIEAGNFVGPVNSYTGLPYGTSNYHWWLNSPYKTAGIPTGVDKDYRQTIACGAGPMRTYSFDTHRVVGGITASRNSWPGIVALRLNENVFCGGSLIAPTKILTAAHCVDWIRRSDIPNLTVDLGMHVQSPSDAQVTKNVRRISIHWGWNSKTNANDIAVLTLSTPVTYTSTISPVCLPANSDLYANQEAAIIGWGTTKEGGAVSSVLQQATVKVTTNAQCKTSYVNLASSMLCAAVPGKDTCQGDSGGPLLVRASLGSPWTQAGIVSFGVGCARPDYPGVYTRVSSYRTWIWLQTLF